MGDCKCQSIPADADEQQRTVAIVLALNGAMFVMEMVAGILADSSSLVASASGP